MIRHILLFKFNEGEPADVRDDAIQRLEALGGQCPTVQSWSIGVNKAESPSAYDVAEVADFTDMKGLNEYKAHPAHRELAAHLGTICTWALVDYTFDV